MTVYTALWVRSSNPETHRVRGVYQAMQNSNAEAIESLSQTLRLKPDDADAHCLWPIYSAIKTRRLKRFSITAKRCGPTWIFPKRSTILR